MIRKALNDKMQLSTELIHHIWNMSTVCPKICMQHFWKIIYKNTHTCERSAIETKGRENVQDIFISTLSFFTGTKADFLGRYIMGNIYILSPFGNYSVYLAKFVNIFIGYLYLFCNAKSLWFFFYFYSCFET